MGEEKGIGAKDGVHPSLLNHNDMITVIGSLKGGAGKSTVAFNLSLWLMAAGKTVAAFDLDPQATLTDAAEVRKEEGFTPLLSVYNRYPAKPTKEKSPAESEETIIDVGAANMQGMKRAITLADRILIPVAPSQADIWSAQRFLYLIASTIDKNKPLQVLVFLNRADTNPVVRESDQAEEVLTKLPGITVLKTRLCQRTTFRRSFSEGLAVFELEPEGKATQEFESLVQILYPDVKKAV